MPQTPTPTCRSSWKKAALGALALAVSTASAHDTWFAAQPGPRAGDWLLALGTGERFPRQAFTISPALLQRQGCRHAQAAVVAMRPLRVTPTALQLRARPVDGARRGQSPAVTCWAELQPLDITIEPAKVPVYLDEIAASPALRAAWADLHGRGLPWVERYSKHARVELFDLRLGGGEPPAARPVPLGMDIVLDGPRQPPSAGDQVRFQVLRDGRPLAGQAIEARSSLSPQGLWVRTDAEGRAAVRLPLPGAWLLRGTDLRLSTERPDTWDSRFVTLSLEVVPR